MVQLITQSPQTCANVARSSLKNLSNDASWHDQDFMPSQSGLATPYRQVATENTPPILNGLVIDLRGKPWRKKTFHWSIIIVPVSKWSFGVDPIDKLPSGWEKVPLQSLAKGGRVQRISNTHGLKRKTSETMGFPMKYWQFL